MSDPSHRVLFLAAHGAILLTLFVFALDHYPVDEAVANILIAGTVFSLLGLATSFLSKKSHLQESWLLRLSAAVFFAMAILWVLALIAPGVITVDGLLER